MHKSVCVVKVSICKFVLIGWRHTRYRELTALLVTPVISWLINDVRPELFNRFIYAYDTHIPNRTLTPSLLY